MLGYQESFRCVEHSKFICEDFSLPQNKHTDCGHYVLRFIHYVLHFIQYELRFIQYELDFIQYE